MTLYFDYNKDINRREQIIFKQDYNKNNDADFKKAWKEASQSDDIWATSPLYSQYYVGGIRRFEDLSIDQLKTLVAEDFIHTDDGFNSCPTVGEFIKLVEKMTSMAGENDELVVTFIGYAVDMSRADYRVTIEGIKYKSRYKLDRDILDEFYAFTKNADELSLSDTEGRAWWD